MLSSAVKITPLARVSQSRVLASRVIAPTAASLLRGSQSHQARYFWSGLWSSYLDPENDPDKLGRCRARMRYRYTRAMKRQLSWDKSLKAHQESLLKAARMHSFDPDKMAKMRMQYWDSFWRRHEDESQSSTVGRDSDYVIDPITNRKVPKHPTNIADPAPKEDTALWEKRRKRLEDLHRDLERAYMDATEEPRAFHSDGPPPADELEKYREVEIGIPSHNEELIHRVTDLPKEKPKGVAPEPPQPATEAPEPPSDIKDELEGYKKVDINYPPSMNEELIHRVNDKPEPTENNELPAAASERKASASTSESEPECEYEDLDKYKPYMPSEETVDPNSADVQARSWPSRVRHLEQQIGADTTSKAVQSKAKTSSASNGVLNSHQASTSQGSPLSRRMRTRADAAGPKTEPAMFDYDPYSKEPTGLETSWAEECKQDPKANKMYIHHYYADGTASEPVVVAPSGDGVVLENNDVSSSTIQVSDLMEPSANQTLAPPSSSKPVLYKILAYDPTNRSIHTAETTSIVQDASAPMSPAEVMTRLTHAHKFLPYFQTLQDEGFEIASGSGNVLVFRQTKKTAEPTPVDVNPIDMMGRRVEPEVGNYASPTGFVNYDNPMDEYEVPSSTSAQDPSRTEKSWNKTASEPSPQETTKPKRPGIMKRTATGAAWLAGTAYGVGVASEFVNKRRNTD